MTNVTSFPVTIPWLGEPGGRLSLSSTAAVQFTSVAGATTIYYLPLIHAQLPIVGLMIPAAGVSLALDSNGAHTGFQASGNNYDLFLYNNAGTLILATGPAWSSPTSRGTGAGTTQIDQTTVPGIWTNTNSITLRFGIGSGDTLTAAGGMALYVGTMYASANGQCTMQFSATGAGGGNTLAGLFNAYNTKRAIIASYDNTTTWSYSSTTWRETNNSASNRVSWIDGLGQMQAMAHTMVLAGTSGGANAAVGVNFDVTIGTPGGVLSNQANSNTSNVSGAAMGSNELISGGFHYAQAMEVALTGTVAFTGFVSAAVGQFQRIAVEIDF